MSDNNSALAVRDSAAIMERAVIRGDLADLTPEERVEYYARLCSSLKLNPYSKPFRYLELAGEGGAKQVVLYASRDCTDQLRTVHKVSITRLEKERQDGLYIVTAYAVLPDGRTDSAVGAVPIVKENGQWKTSQSGKRYLEADGTFSPIVGEALANAIMKAETKAKRRVTLSICGLGMTDESEIDSIAGARSVDLEYPDVDAAEMVISADHRVWKRWLEVQEEARGLGLNPPSLTLPMPIDELKRHGAEILERIDARLQQLQNEDAERAVGKTERDIAKDHRAELWQDNRRLVEEARKRGIEGAVLNTRSGDNVIEAANAELRERIERYEQEQAEVRRQKAQEGLR